MKDVREIVESLLVIILIIFGLYIVYQIIRYLLGGSWTVEDIIISLLLFILGALLTISIYLAKVGVSVAKLGSDHNHLSRQFRSLANDFKKYVKK